MYKSIKTKKYRKHKLVGGWTYESNKKLEDSSEIVNSGSSRYNSSSRNSSRSKSSSTSNRKKRHKNKRVKGKGLKTRKRGN